MARIELENISYRYTANTNQGVVENISLAVEQGQVACLVGASGSGKTTILRLISGFLTPDAGSIRIGQQLVATAGRLPVPPHKREVGLVFQHHALFPHLNVAKNILFGSHAADRKSQLAQLMADLHLEGYEKRFPHELSGGEQQRVALARALASEPKALLMDEPFASIDSVLRRKIRSECIAVLRAKGITSLLVTHDAEEAMELADHIYVIEHGRIVQSGTPHSIYTQPANAYVAGLFGDINIIEDEALAQSLGGKAAPLLLRPAALALSAGGQQGVVAQLHYRGGAYLVHVQLSGGAVLKVHSPEAVALGQSVRVALA